MPATYVAGVTAPTPRPEGLSRYGVIPIPGQRTSHGITRRVMRLGLRRYERVCVWSRLHTGQVQHLRRGVLVLPDKEFRYLRTVIVTAAVYWGLGSELRRS